MATWEEVPLFISNTKTAIFGRSYGNFHPESGGLNDAMRKVREEMSGRICLLRCAFVNKIIDLASDLPIRGPRNLYELSSEVGDGLYLPTSLELAGLGICNADCPVICAEVFNGRRIAGIAMLHAGLNNLVPPSGPSIIEAFGEFLVAKGYRAVIRFSGYGIGACCYGIDEERAERIRSMGGDAASTIGTATRGPRDGMVSTDPGLLAIVLPAKLINTYPFMAAAAVEPRCTACSAENGKRLFWSHVYDDKEDVKFRNLTAFCFR